MLHKKTFLIQFKQEKNIKRVGVNPTSQTLYFSVFFVCVHFIGGGTLFLIHLIVTYFVIKYK